MPITTDQEEKTQNDGNDNLSNDKVKVGIKPDVEDNKVNINICAFTFICYCFSKQ